MPGFLCFGGSNCGQSVTELTHLEALSAQNDALARRLNGSHVVDQVTVAFYHEV